MDRQTATTVKRTEKVIEKAKAYLEYVKHPTAEKDEAALEALEIEVMDAIDGLLSYLERKSL